MHGSLYGFWKKEKNSSVGIRSTHWNNFMLVLRCWCSCLAPYVLCIHNPHYPRLIIGHLFFIYVLPLCKNPGVHLLLHTGGNSSCKSCVFNLCALYLRINTMDVQLQIVYLKSIHTLWPIRNVCMCCYFCESYATKRFIHIPPLQGHAH